MCFLVIHLLSLGLVASLLWTNKHHHAPQHTFGNMPLHLHLAPSHIALDFDQCPLAWKSDIYEWFIDRTVSWILKYLNYWTKEEINRTTICSDLCVSANMRNTLSCLFDTHLRKCQKKHLLMSQKLHKI